MLSSPFLLTYDIIFFVNMVNTIKSFFKRNSLYIILLLIAVFLFVTFASESSFLYRTNEWDDVHCFYTVSSALRNGKVLYRDIYEQKGPYLYFIHMFAIALSPGRYLGGYFLELIYGWIFAFALFKIFRLFIYNKKVCLLGTALVLVTYYISFAFNKGDSIEEMMTPLYAVSLYWLIRMAKGIKNITWYQLFIAGLFAGLAFFSKFTLISFFAGFVIMIFVINVINHKTKRGFIDVGLFLLGLLVSALPAIIYFGSNNAFSDFYTVYIYNNIFHYSSAESSGFINRLSRMAEAWYVRFAFGYSYYLFILFGFFYIVFNKRIRKDIVFYSVLAPYITLNLIIVLGGVSYSYYGLPNALFAFIGVYALYDLLTHKQKSNDFVNKHQKPLQIATISLLTIISFVGTPNLPRMFVSKDKIMEYNMRDIILKENNPTVLNYGALDVGVYYLCDIQPTTKYFTGLNGHFEELEKEQQRIVDDCEVMFVIARVDNLPLNIDEHYEVVYTGSLNDVGRHYKFNLYKLK